VNRRSSGSGLGSEHLATIDRGEGGKDRDSRAGDGFWPGLPAKMVITARREEPQRWVVAEGRSKVGWKLQATVGIKPGPQWIRCFVTRCRVRYAGVCFCLPTATWRRPWAPRAWPLLEGSSCSVPVADSGTRSLGRPDKVRF